MQEDEEKMQVRLNGQVESIFQKGLELEAVLGQDGPSGR